MEEIVNSLTVDEEALLRNMRVVDCLQEINFVLFRRIGRSKTMLMCIRPNVEVAAEIEPEVVVLDDDIDDLPAVMPAAAAAPAPACAAAATAALDTVNEHSSPSPTPPGVAMPPRSTTGGYLQPAAAALSSLSSATAEPAPAQAKLESTPTPSSLKRRLSDLFKDGNVTLYYYY